MSGRFLLLFLQNEKGVKTFNIPFLFTSPQPTAHDEIVWTFLSSLQGASMGHRVKNYVERYHAEFWGFLDNLFFLLNCKPPAIKPFNLNLSKCTFHCFSSWGLSFPPLSIIIDFFFLFTLFGSEVGWFSYSASLYLFNPQITQCFHAFLWLQGLVAILRHIHMLKCIQRLGAFHVAQRHF